MAPGESTVYCIDTSSLVNLHKWRPSHRHPEVWDRLEQLIDEHRLVAPRAVLRELHKVNDVLLAWARSHKRMFKPESQDLVKAAQRIVRRFPGLVDPDQFSQSADAFVVALATQVHSGRLFPKKEEVIVITEERYGQERPRIPNVCEAYHLKYLTIHQLFLFERWSF